MTLPRSFQASTGRTLLSRCTRYTWSARNSGAWSSKPGQRHLTRGPSLLRQPADSGTSSCTTLGSFNLSKVPELSSSSIPLFSAAFLVRHPFLSPHGREEAAVQGLSRVFDNPLLRPGLRLQRPSFLPSSGQHDDAGTPPLPLGHQRALAIPAPAPNRSFTTALPTRSGRREHLRLSSPTSS